MQNPVIILPHGTMATNFVPNMMYKSEPEQILTLEPILGSIWAQFVLWPENSCPGPGKHFS